MTIIKLILIVVMPATNASSERSFSAMHRMKSYLRSTMKQERLNHLMFLQVHKQLIDTLNLADVANDFVSSCDHRLSIWKVLIVPGFGKTLRNARTPDFRYRRF